MAFSRANVIGFMTLAITAFSAAFECEKSSEHCITSLEIGYAYTMVSATHGPVVSRNRKLFLASNDTIELPIESPITTADGFRKTRKLITANGTMPGPDIIIYENQKITVIVKNNLFNEDVTVHWHGIDQLTWPFMDGVSFITQCPISPGQSFNYTFQPRFGGTYWYHSHVGNQRDYGLFGAFVILRSNEDSADVGNLLMVGEWNHQHGSTTVMTAKDLNSSPQSVLINGMGEFENNEAPLEVISAMSGETIRFRMIGIGSHDALLLSIEGHQLNVIETDGFRVEETTVDKIIIYPAERYDFTVDVGSQGIYNITVDILTGPHLKLSDDFRISFSQCYGWIKHVYTSNNGQYI